MCVLVGRDPDREGLANQVHAAVRRRQLPQDAARAAVLEGAAGEPRHLQQAVHDRPGQAARPGERLVIVGLVEVLGGHGVLHHAPGRHRGGEDLRRALGYPRAVRRPARRSCRLRLPSRIAADRRVPQPGHLRPGVGPAVRGLDGVDLQPPGAAGLGLRIDHCGASLQRVTDADVLLPTAPVPAVETGRRVRMPRANASTYCALRNDGGTSSGSPSVGRYGSWASPDTSRTRSARHR